MKKIKLGICCNFGPPHCGGSEYVLENIAAHLMVKYDYEINIYGFNYKKVSTYRGMNLIPCQKGDRLISQIAKNDHIIVYSDSFWEFDTLVRNIEKIDCGVSLALVGAYHLQSHPEIFKLFKENIDKFNLITHSLITPDYKWCIDNDLPVKVILNGVNIEEFSQNTVNFREKYNIKEKYIVLNVGNYFFGKGFELLPKICRKIKSKDFIVIQCSNSVQYSYDKVFLDRTKKQSKGLNIRFLRDLPREDVVAAFKCSDVFLFSSKKEVAPLVILESRAAKLPWVSMDVGNVGESTGGAVISNNDVDRKGYKIVNDEIVDNYVDNIVQILKNKNERERYISEGQENIDQIDWKNIVNLYHEVFSK